MDTAISIVGLYFTLIGFISGLFFTRLDSWYGQVREILGALAIVKLADDKLSKYRETRAKVYSLRESAPKGSFIVIGIFTIALTCLSFFVPIETLTKDLFIFIRLPLVITILVYWIGGIILFKNGKKLLNDVDKELARVLDKK